MQEEGKDGKGLMLHILAVIEASGKANSRTVAAQLGAEHDEVVRVVLSMIANELVVAQHV